MEARKLIKHLDIKVSGFVQGIFFRVTAKEQADNLGIKGFARNEPDGSVYIEAEGDNFSLDKFLTWCKNGPEAAQVKKIEVIEGKFKNFSDFSRN